MIIAGAELENIQKCRGTTVLRPVVLKEAKIEANTALKGCIKVNEATKSVKFQYSVNGKRIEKIFRYAKCGLDEAMKKAEEEQIKVSM